MPSARNPYNPNGVYPSDYLPRPSHNLSTDPPVFTPVNWNQPLADRPHDERVSPKSSRHSRSRVRPEAVGSNYIASRAANQASRARPVTPPSLPMHLYDGPPGPRPKSPTIAKADTYIPHKFPHSPGKGGPPMVIPDKRVQQVAYVSRRGSLVPKDADGKIRPPQPFVFDHGSQVDPGVPCNDACAHFRFTSKESYNLNGKAYKPLIVKQPSPIFQANGFIVFKDRRTDIAFDGKTARGSGVLLQDVLRPPQGFSLVDDDEVVDLGNLSMLEVNIDVNGFPTTTAQIHLKCAHGRLTRFGILKAVAQQFYKTTHMKGPGNGESRHRNKLLPKKIKFENIRLISLYAVFGRQWNVEFLYVAEKESKS